MKYVALLRGINVGGNNKIDMKQIAVAMTKAGFDDVSTYINSGNIFFNANESKIELTNELEQLINKEFGLEIRVLLRDKDNIDKLTHEIPPEWKNNSEMRCDVMFLWEKYNNKSILEKLLIKPEIDEVKFVHGALIWRVDRNNITKSGMLKLIGSDIYAHMTIRNCNTVRKIQVRLDS